MATLNLSPDFDNELANPTATTSYPHGISGTYYYFAQNATDQHKVVWQFSLPASLGAITAVKLKLVCAGSSSNADSAEIHNVLQTGITSGMTWNKYDGTNN